MFSIYKITNKTNNKIYIGLTSKTVDKRIWSHFNDGKNNNGFYLHSAIHKYGKDNFIVTTLEENIGTIIEARCTEIYYIARYNSFGKNGYNLTKGGEFSDHNRGFTNALNSYGDLERVTVEEYSTRDDLVHLNKNKVTIYKESESKRVSSEDYLNFYKIDGWETRNSNLVTVKEKSSGKIIKIPSENFTKELYEGINSGHVSLFNKLSLKLERVASDNVDLKIYSNFLGIQYEIYDSKGILIQLFNNISDITDKNGRVQFSYMYRNNKNFESLEITEEILEKLKVKSRNYSLIGYKLIKKKYK